MNARLMNLLLLVCCLAGLSGCVVVRPEEQVFEPLDILGDAAYLKPVGAVDTTNWFPLWERGGRYLMTEGDDEGEAFAYRLRPGGEGTWRLEYEGRQVVYMRFVEGVGLTIEREDDLDEEVRVEWSPAIIALPARMEAGRAQEGDVKITVRSLDDGDLRDRGTCHYAVELLGSQRIVTPAGKKDCMIVRLTRKIKLPLAEVEVVVLTAYSPGQGQMAERVEQTTHVMELFSVLDVVETRLAK